MKSLLLAAVIAVAACGAAQAQPAAAPAAPAAASAKMSVDSTLTALIANPKSHAVLEKHMPILLQFADMIPDGMTLKQLSEVEEAKAIVTPEAMKSVTEDLAKL